jgi:hypothetical protein
LLLRRCRGVRGWGIDRGRLRLGFGDRGFLRGGRRFGRRWGLRRRLLFLVVGNLRVVRSGHISLHVYLSQYSLPDLLLANGLRNGEIPISSNPSSNSAKGSSPSEASSSTQYSFDRRVFRSRLSPSRPSSLSPDFSLEAPNPSNNPE